MPVIAVVAGVVRDVAGRVLMAQRPVGKELAGCWEFPGGKLEAGESAAVALVRELREELDIVAHGVDPRPLASVPVHRAGRELNIEALWVRRWTGVPHPCEGQGMGWFWPQDVIVADLAPADQTILEALLAALDLSPPDHSPV